MAQKTIAWIDDDIDIIDPVVRPLERANYHILRLGSVKETWDSLEAIRNADLLLLAMTIPTGRISSMVWPSPRSPRFELSGLQLLYELRVVHGIHIPVVVFTSIHPSQIKHQLARLGNPRVLHKPARPSELKQVIEEVLDSP